jgi:hypothetical protein
MYVPLCRMGFGVREVVIGSGEGGHLRLLLLLGKLLRGIVVNGAAAGSGVRTGWCRHSNRSACRRSRSRLLQSGHRLVVDGANAAVGLGRAARVEEGAMQV